VILAGTSHVEMQGERRGDIYLAALCEEEGLRVFILQQKG